MYNSVEYGDNLNFGENDEIMRIKSQNHVMFLESFKKTLNLADGINRAEIHFEINIPSTVNLNQRQELGQEIM